MIAKKNSRYDLERKRSVLFQVGLLAASSFVLAAFTYTSTEQSEFEGNQVAYDMVTYETEVIEKPQEKEEVVERRQEEQQQQQTEPQDQTAGSNTALSENVNTAQNTNEVPGPGLDLPNFGNPDGGTIIIDEDPVDPFPVKEAEYVGGFVAMQEFIVDRLEYPEIDLEEGNQGKVFISFIVERDGSVSNVEIVRGVTPTIDREAKRIVSAFPKWIPGENAYGKVRTIVRLPLKFTTE